MDGCEYFGGFTGELRLVDPKNNHKSQITNPEKRSGLGRFVIALIALFEICDLGFVIKIYADSRFISSGLNTMIWLLSPSLFSIRDMASLQAAWPI